MRLIDTNIRCNAVAPGATITPAHLANKAGEQPGGNEMLKYSGHYVYFPGRNVKQWIRHMPACIWPARWAELSVGRCCRSAMVRFCKRLILKQGG